MNDAMTRKLAVLLATFMALSLFAGCAQKEAATSVTEGIQTESGFRVGYAMEGVTALEEGDALNEAVDEAYKQMMDSRIALDYKNEAYSKDGIEFDCYIGNSNDNVYDLFIAIYANPDYTDELFLSQLLRPGTAFERIKLNHALEPGTHEVVVLYSLVEDVDGEQTIRGQLPIMMDFIVTP